MRGVAVLVLCGLIAVVSAVQSAPPEELPVGHEDYELGVGEEEFVEEPTTTTARPTRRRLPGSRAKAKNGDVSPRTTTTTTTTTEKPAKRSRSGGHSSSADRGSRTTTPKTVVDASERPASTYRRPKFPPRRLPIPTKKPTTEAPLEEFFTDDPLYADGPAAEGPLGPDGQPETPLEEELVQEGAR